MDVKKYFNQIAIYKKYRYTTGHGTTVYEEPEAVTVRLETDKTTFEDTAGKILSIKGFYMIKKEDISVGDLFIYNNKEYMVVNAEEVIDKKAKYIYTEGWLI